LFVCLFGAGFTWWEAWCNFALKIGGTKLGAPKALRIKMLKASREMRNGDGTPLTLTSRQWSNYILIYEGDVKYGEYVNCGLVLSLLRRR